MPLVVKIGDFGISKHVEDKTELQTFAGSQGYMAPEIWGYSDARTSKYTNAVDIWSLGCVVYAMITGEPPFPETPDFLKYIQREITFPATKLKNIPSMATEFITSLLVPRPQDRLTAETALQHPWLAVEQGSETFWQEIPLRRDPSRLKQRWVAIRERPLDAPIIVTAAESVLEQSPTVLQGIIVSKTVYLDCAVCKANIIVTSSKRGTTHRSSHERPSEHRKADVR